MNSYVEVTKISASSLLVNKNKFVITHCSRGAHHSGRILAVHQMWKLEVG